MGGSVTVVIRRPDGTMHVMLRWTNPLPYFVANMKFINEEKAFIDDYVECWKNKKIDEGKPPENDGFVPEDYGIVVIDMINKLIVSKQEYTSFNITSFSNSFSKEDKENDYARIRGFVEGNRIIEYWNFGETRTMESFNGDTKALMKAIENDELAGIFTVDLRPYKLLKYETFKGTKEKLDEIGFKFTGKEEEAWANLISEEEFDG